MKVNLGAIFTNATCICVFALMLHGAELPHVKIENGAGQLLVKGEPFLILAGELGNSSAGTAAEADVIIPKLAAMHVNTVLMPVAWEQIEPKEYRVRFYSVSLPL